jgi:hypothetical protein
MAFVRERDPLEIVASNHDPLLFQGLSGSSKRSSVSSTEGAHSGVECELSAEDLGSAFGSYHEAQQMME